MTEQQNNSLQDDRERKGAFYTPKIWVEKSQEYLANVFGENWQDEYYIWDCCCGTGNLLAGLVNPYNIWASTIDQADVDILHTSINNRKCNLLDSHVFRFDFLNGNFDELPKELRDIINDPEKRKRLIVYMNPPYAEATSHKRRTKSGVAKNIEANFKSIIGAASNEIYAYFFAKIYQQIPEGKLASFSTIKYVNAPNFAQFRDFFKASFGKGFLVPANTFDNVHGQFPIGFLIWDFEKKRKITEILCDVFNADGVNIGRKRVYGNLPPSINKWIALFNDNTEQGIGYLNCVTPMFQNQGYVWIDLVEQITHCLHLPIHSRNLVVGAIYFAVRHCIKADWINNRDQFLFPNDGYKKDRSFQNDCLIFTLFHHQNRVKSLDGINHWIPFTAREVAAKDNFKSAFMSDFLQKRKLSKEAKAVFESGKALWTYYHEKTKKLRTPPVNASLYEIREYFKGRDEKGRMKSKAADERFNELDAKLRSALKVLALKIQPKVYEYGFLNK